MMLQINQNGAWRNVARFEAGDEAREVQVRKAASFAATALRCKFRLLADDNSVIAHCDAAGLWEEWRKPA